MTVTGGGRQPRRSPEITPTEAADSSPTLLTALFLIALAGRITPERVGLQALGVEDFRRPTYAILAGGVLIWQLRLVRRGGVRPWPRFLLPFTALIALQLTSALWAPWPARMQQATEDLVLLWLLVVCTAALTAGNPRRAARVLLALMLLAGLAYAVAGLNAGAQLQGRVSAFGGGPNVFVRVVCLAAIAAVTLAVARRRWWLLVPVPVLAVAAVLSGSRGGLVAGVGTVTAFFLFFLRRRRVVVLASTLVVGGAATWLVWQVMGGAIAGLAATRYNAGVLEANGYSARPELLDVAWQLFRDNLIAGAGMDAFNVATGMGYPHNLVAGLAAEAGLLGLGLFAWAVVRWCRDGVAWSTATPEQIGCAVCAVYVLLASMFSGDYYDARFMWIFAVVAVSRPRPSVAGPGRRKAVDQPYARHPGRRATERAWHPAG
ncbi:O-antigen ligase [Micromonospora sp. CNB394]|uniref:O-antigen ligase family protein n=1 Tax=Micromonospora sp. CNB394 TaxID=1169151 RepID=UPI0003806AD6|nr:O-antigen ligase family protein [Micromonospora sp. CNB394]